jgi:hypothetical protein
MDTQVCELGHIASQLNYELYLYVNRYLVNIGYDYILLFFTFLSKQLIFRLPLGKSTTQYIWGYMAASFSF